MGLLASVEGGVTEEVQLRLFFLSFVALGIRTVGGFARRQREAALTLTPATFWAANLVAAVAFGLGHLPITARLIPLTPVVVTRAIVLNGIPGVIAGWLFWRRGIEMAMVCHFSADVLLHVVAPLLQPWLLRR
jgi:membrane protease YdiL (CAAX protease family)